MHKGALNAQLPVPFPVFNHLTTSCYHKTKHFGWDCIEWAVDHFGLGLT